ncbi:MAG: ribosome maturation factor RimP [Bacillota bacterium]
MNREETRQKLIELIEPLIESKGFELVHLDYIAGKQGRLNLYIDHDDGITISHCELISGVVSDILDDLDPIPHAYTLEVSSPGFDRPLTKTKHFIRFLGEKVRVITSEPIGGSSKFSGILKSADDQFITVTRDDGSEVKISYDLIKKANLRYTETKKKKGL